MGVRPGRRIEDVQTQQLNPELPVLRLLDIDILLPSRTVQSKRFANALQVITAQLAENVTHRDRSPGKDGTKNIVFALAGYAGDLKETGELEERGAGEASEDSAFVGDG